MAIIRLLITSPIPPEQLEEYPGLQKALVAQPWDAETPFNMECVVYREIPEAGKRVLFIELKDGQILRLSLTRVHLPPGAASAPNQGGIRIDRPSTFTYECTEIIPTQKP